MTVVSIRAAGTEDQRQSSKGVEPRLNHLNQCTRDDMRTLLGGLGKMFVARPHICRFAVTWHIAIKLPTAALLRARPY